MLIISKGGGSLRRPLCQWRRHAPVLCVESVTSFTRALWLQHRQCCSQNEAPSSGSSSDVPRPCLFRVPITPEMIEVECVTTYSTTASASSSSSAADSSTDGTAAGSGATPTGAPSSSSAASHTSVHRVDPFSRGRMLNYLRRMGFKGDTPFTTKSHTVVSDIPSSSITGGRNAVKTSMLYTATLRLPLPAPHGSYVAEGTGETVKDAELLAAMHAERVCDALGVPLFRLPSMQQKYAENVRKTEGRYAPLPGDPLKPEGTPLPPPLRMVSAATEAAKKSSDGGWSSSGGGSSSSASAASDTASFFSCRVAEAEIISSTTTVRLRPVATEKKPAPSSVNATTRQAASAPSAVPSANQQQEQDPRDALGTHSTTPVGGWVEEYQQSIYIPWASSSHRSPTTVSSAPTPSSSPSQNYDPTEGGTWQLTNIVSARLPPSKEALALPCVLDVEAIQRMKDYFLQRGVGKIDECFTVTHVTVRPAGTISRMYVAELDLRQRSLRAVGKANSREVAMQLAAMHAELLLDSLGIPLFPNDGGRQERHAAAARRFGRWAPSTTVDSSPAYPLPSPLPLKQLVGGDDVWLDPTTMKHTYYQRTDGERLIAAHNELNFLCSDAIEVYPPEELLEEAQDLLRRWQRNIAGNPYPDAIVMTRMGAFFRAATITPVPRCFGVRGGIAIGRTVEQAEALCALHAVDSLSALGIPLFQSAEEQRAFVAKRKAMGLPTCEDLAGLAHLKEWQPQEAAVIRVPEVQEAMKATAEQDESMIQWKLLMAAMTTQHGMSGVASASARQLVPPYLPAYIVEGAAPRRMPHIHSTRTVMQLSVANDCEEYGKDCKEDELISVGNEVKVCVQNYLRHQYALSSDNGVEKGSGWGTLPLPLVPSVCLTGYGRTGASVYNVAYLTLPSPRRGAPASSTLLTSAAGKKKKKTRMTTVGAAPAAPPEDAPPTPQAQSTSKDSATEESPSSHLAIGFAMKKKDAERACYLHAAATLFHKCGEDVLLRHRAGLPRQSLVSSYEALRAKCLSPPPPSSVEDGPTPMDGSSPHEPNGEEKAPLFSYPKPFIHTTMSAFLKSGRFEAPSKPKRPSPF